MININSYVELYGLVDAVARTLAHKYPSVTSEHVQKAALACLGLNSVDRIVAAIEHVFEDTKFWDGVTLL